MKIILNLNFLSPGFFLQLRLNLPHPSDVNFFIRFANLMGYNIRARSHHFYISSSSVSLSLFVFAMSKLISIQTSGLVQDYDVKASTFFM